MAEKKKRKWYIKFAIIITVIVAFNALIDAGRVKYNSIPACNNTNIANEVITDKLGNALGLVGYKIYKISNIREMRSNLTDIRKCKAVLDTSGGVRNIEYFISWEDKKKGFVEVDGKVVFFLIYVKNDKNFYY